MNARIILLGAVAALGWPALLPAANIDRATLTEVVNRVSVIDAGTKRSAPARTQQLFTAPNVLRTGADSRAEMIAPDSTVTRVGQNSLFSFEPNSREIDLQKGSILFQSPSGKGGGTIRTPAASAAVLGTTLIVTTTKNGGFKVLLVEGKGSVKTNTGKFAKLSAGQMVYALPGGDLSNTFEFRLSQQVAASRLLGGFKKPIPSLAKIQAAVQKQEKEIAEGKAVASNLLASDSPNFAIRVDVARDTIIAASRGNEPVLTGSAAAAASDAIIDQPALDSTRIFPGPTENTQFAAQTFRPDDVNEEGFTSGFAFNPLFFLGNNVIFDTPLVDLSPFAANDVVRFQAVNDLSFNQSADLEGFSAGDIQFLAGRTIRNNPGTLIKTSAENVAFVALGSALPAGGDGIISPEDFSPEVPLTLNQFSVQNSRGSLLFLAGQIDFIDVQFAADKSLGIAARQDISIQGSSDGEFQKVGQVFIGGTIRPVFALQNAKLSNLASNTEVRVAAQRNLTISRTNIASPSTLLESGRNVRLTAVRIGDGSQQLPSFFESEGSPSEVNTGPQSVKVVSRQLADLRSVNFVANNVRIESNTIRLEGVQFRDGSRVVLASEFGLLAGNPNSNRPVLAGYVNFVRGVQYGSEAAQQAVIESGTRGSGISIQRRDGRPVPSRSQGSP